MLNLVNTVSTANRTNHILAQFDELEKVQVHNEQECQLVYKKLNLLALTKSLLMIDVLFPSYITCVKTITSILNFALTAYQKSAAALLLPVLFGEKCDLLYTVNKVCITH